MVNVRQMLHGTVTTIAENATNPWLAGAILFGLTVCGGLSILTLSIWPGVYDDVLWWLMLLFPLGCVALCVPPVWVMLVIAQLTWELLSKERPRRRLCGSCCILAALSTFALLWFNVPQRAVFLAFSSEFQALADAPRAADGSRRWDLRRQIGPYFVYACGVDRAGGVYFLTHTGPDGIGPDQMEYGFAYRPVRDGVPFGRTRHQIRHLFGDWYTFEGSDD